MNVEHVDFISVPVTDMGHMAPFDDPDGNRFMLHRRYAPHD